MIMIMITIITIMMIIMVVIIIMMIMMNTRQTRQDLQAEPGARTLMSGMQENFTGEEGDDDEDNDQNYDKKHCFRNMVARALTLSHDQHRVSNNRFASVFYISNNVFTD